jgi:nuclear autoantigenic sperm protein
VRASCRSRPPPPPGASRRPAHAAAPRPLLPPADIALECASAYYRYGSALFYHAQDSADVFGGPMRGGLDDEDKENEAAAQEEEEAAEAEEEPPAAAVAGSEAAPPADDKGKGPAQESPPGPAGDVVAGGPATGGEGDLQLAWENLETARAIWSRDAASHHTELASTHGLLGDVNMEEDAFDAALANYDAGLAHQAAAGFAPDDRRAAELHFKRCFALQLLDRPEESLEAVRTAAAVLRLRQASLAAPEGARPEGSAPPGANEVSDVATVLEDLEAKVEELEGVVAEVAATKAALRSTMEQLAGVQAGKAAAAAGGPQSTEQAGFDRPVVVSPVKDLGVVGRGRKRINLAPEGAAGAGAGAAAAAAAGPEPKKKRSLEDLMGGAGGDSATGFGAPAPAAAAAPAAPQAAPLPAFLQAYAAPPAKDGAEGQP